MLYYSRLRCVHPVHRTFYQDQDAIYHAVRPCTSLRIATFIFKHMEFSCVRTGYGAMESTQFCLKPGERVNVKWHNHN